MVPTPPEAMIGTGTAARTARSRSRSKPDLVPSRSMLVSRISPAPAAAMRCAQPTASIPVPRRPPWVKTSHRPGPTCRASTATTIAWLPKASAARETNSGSATAALLMLALSAPASSSRRISSTLRMPPPTVSGMKTSAAVRAMTSYIVSRFSCVAPMSRKVTSSAPSRS